MTFDPDTLRDQWHDVQANDAFLDWWQRQQAFDHHRWPPDIPPCPAYQDIETRKYEREFGSQ